MEDCPGPPFDEGGGPGYLTFTAKVPPPSAINVPLPSTVNVPSTFAVKVPSTFAVNMLSTFTVAFPGASAGISFHV